MCNLLITLYLPFSISNSKVISSHIIWKLQQKGFIHYIWTCDTSMVSQIIGYKEGSYYYILKRIINSIFISWFHDEQRRSNNYLGIFLTAMRIKSVSLNHWHVAEYFHLNFFFTACLRLSLHISFSKTLHFSYVRSTRST